jgi:hypothetical protein
MDPASTQADTIPAASAQTARNEKRIARAMAVHLSRTGSLQSAEETFTDNISPCGARVVTKQQWQPEERILLKSLLGDLVSQARVVYCERLSARVFAVGLDLLLAAGKWTLSSR